MIRSPITTHILNLSSGEPARGVEVSLLSHEGAVLGRSTTDDDGRIDSWPEELILCRGDWTLIFETRAWFAQQNVKSFFNNVHLSFHVDVLDKHYHVPLLLNAYGYSTYRGS